IRSLRLADNDLSAGILYADDMCLNRAHASDVRVRRNEKGPPKAGLSYPAQGRISASDRPAACRRSQQAWS
ncbi:hypothetical protein ABTJ74_19665, partial [Acinetobacter baumannii]